MLSEGWLRVPGFPLTAGRPLYSELKNTLRGLVLRFGFPLAAERPLYSELKNTLRGIVPRSGFPLAAERPLYSELVDTDTTTPHVTYIHDCLTHTKRKASGRGFDVGARR